MLGAMQPSRWWVGLQLVLPGVVLEPLAWLQAWILRHLSLIHI